MAYDPATRAEAGRARGLWHADKASAELESPKDPTRQSL